MFFQKFVLKGVAQVRGWLPGGEWEPAGALLPSEALSLARFVQSPALPAPLGRAVRLLVRSETCSRSKRVCTQFQGEKVLNIDIRSLQPVLQPRANCVCQRLFFLSHCCSSV